MTDTIRKAVEHEYRRERTCVPLTERLKPIQAHFIELSQPGGLSADKAFFDDLSGDN